MSLSSREKLKVEKSEARPLLAIVGCPNVGKSVLFNRLTGAYATVSNYPGTTVEVMRGKARIGETDVDVVDTPGMYALQPISEEEAVARRLLLQESPRLVLHVLDAKNIRRMLSMTLQLLEAGLPVMLAVNMLDESEGLGFDFDLQELSRLLGIPVIGTAGATNRGIAELRENIRRHIEQPAPRDDTFSLRYDESIERAIEDIMPLISPLGGLSARAKALLLLQDDEEMLAEAREKLPAEDMERLASVIDKARQAFGQPLPVVIALRRQQTAQEIIAQVTREPAAQVSSRTEWLSRILMHPLWGLPMVAIVLYVGIYLFVGVLGGSVVVGFLEEELFGKWLLPPITAFFQHWLPALWSNLFVGEFGVISMGLTYSIAIILPVVGFFFLIFSVLEDSGYLPRLAMLLDRLFKTFGLNGRAVIPLVLGFGCDTMATVVTRILETRRERIIATLLLALAIPCAAQSGLFMAMLGSVQPYGLLIYLVVLVFIFLLVGTLAGKLMPGEQAQFYIELPPLRLPRLSNVLVKTYTRLEWYFLEILPTFLLASVLLWLGSLAWNGHGVIFDPHAGLLSHLERALDPLVALIGLPTTADLAKNPQIGFSGGTILISGFFRRDFGAAGLWHLFNHEMVTASQVLTAAVTLTLFLPCLAQFLVMKKERGLRTALAMSAFVLVVAFGVGYLLRIGLDVSGIRFILEGTGGR